MSECVAQPQSEATNAENFTHLNNDALELKITQLSADINAATCEQVLLMAEFDTRQAWGHEGLRSCAHWLNWRCGISFGAAREKIRVGHALVDLPQTRAAFASGQLSYSKARAITRVATLANEHYLLSYAQYGTASQLEKTCRLYRQQYPITGQINSQEAERLAACHSHDHRQLTTHWDADGCLVIKAKLTAEQGALVLKAISAGVETSEKDESQEENVSAETRDLSKADLDIDAAQRKQANRRADALVLMAETSLHHQTHGSNTADRHQVVVHVDHDALAQSTGFADGLKPDCYIENEVAIPIETARRLSCCSKIVAAVMDGGEVLNIGRSSRAIPPAILRALQIRDGVCQFPGCSCDRHLDAHHIIHWANDGETSLDNLIQVCHYHHKLMHEGGYSVRREDGLLIFTSPDGTEIKQVLQATTSNGPVKSNHEQPWQWNGDSMDYSVAMDGLASADGREVSLI